MQLLLNRGWNHFHLFINLGKTTMAQSQKEVINYSINYSKQQLDRVLQHGLLDSNQRKFQPAPKKQNL